MELLPEECIDLILSHLDVISLTWLGLSSKRLKASCFSLRYWTRIDCSTINDNNITSESVKKLSNFATSLQILNIQNCPRVNLESLVPFVFSFKELELIKHDGEHRLLDETVAVNRMLNKAEQLINKYKHEDDRRKFDSAVRQARALMWDALFVVVANKRGSYLPQESNFENVKHPQETHNLVTKKLREIEKMLLQPLKLWKILTCNSTIQSVSFVTDPRTDKIYLACGVSGEIVLWDMDTRTVFKVFNYLDSLEQFSAEKAVRPMKFISVFVFSHLDRLMIFGGTSRGAVCWDFDTSQIVYEIDLPKKDDNSSSYHALNWAITSQGGVIELTQGVLFIDLARGQLGQYMELPGPDYVARSLLVFSSHSNSVLTAGSDEQDYFVSIIDMSTRLEKQILTLVPSSRMHYGEATIDWCNDQLIAINTNRGVEIYKNQSDIHHQYTLQVIIKRSKVSHVKFLSEQFLLVNDEIFDVSTGDVRIKLEKNTKNKRVAYSPELDVFVKAQDVSITAIYNIMTKKKIGPEAVAPLSSFSKLDDNTVLSYGSFSHSYPYGCNYAKLSLNDCKVLETVETPMQILDVSSDGKYALAQDKHYEYKDRHNVSFIVFEVNTKQIIFQRKFLQDHKSATWSIGAVGQFMPRHPNQVLLSHPKAGFQIFDVTSGKLLRDCSTDSKYEGVDNHIKISPDEKFVVYSAVISNLGCTVAVDLEEDKVYTIKSHSNSSHAITFNPTNPRQILLAGCGISVFNLPSTQRACYLTRYLDGLVQTIRESEEVVFLKFSPDGKYLAAIDPPSRGPWGLEIANTLIRVYETTTFTQVSSFDTGGHARALYWLDNERALVGMINGELMTLQLVVEEYKSLFDYIVPSKAPKS